ncbi:NAD(P)H-binding protein [Microbacterium telephonicum]|uniref:Putative NADH-flavin reductase n=1 Tax=Microbacterium telephonicum TaxID=1714841 RepID=A0A498CA68_9MICO|nr:NAD(P)H-binding protein [Microbacterium telephonicum]RLK52615.1 putative NADH-flavin reductase [Microbacterium telephonicum]
MSAILLIGGHGKVARLLTPLLLADGDTVTSVVRNPDHVTEIGALGAEAVVADAETMTLDEWRGLVEGHDAVVWSAGAGGGSPARTNAIDRDAAVLSMQAALAEGVRRYVMVSWAGSRLDHGIPQSESFFTYAQAKAVADAVLRDSELEWTVIAPSTLTEEPGTGGVAEAKPGGSVPRADVAAVVAAALRTPASIGRTFRFDAGATTVAEFVS